MRWRLAAALLASAALATPASASDSSLSGYSDFGGEAQNGITAQARSSARPPGSAVGGVHSASETPSGRAPGGGGGVPFTGYDALLFAGVGLSLLGLGVTLRLLVAGAVRRRAG